MKRASGRLPRVSERLGFRLGLLLSLALLPLGLIAVLQTASAIEESEARSKAVLLGETLIVVETQLRVIQRARGIAEALATTMETVVADEAECRALMESFAEDSSRFSLVAFVPMNGRISCNSVGQELDVSADPVYQSLLNAAAPQFAVNPQGPAVHRSVIAVSYPVTFDDGEMRGIISINLPHTELYQMQSSGTGTAERMALAHERAAILTFNRQGDLLSSSRGLEESADFLPRDRALAALVGTPPVAFAATSRGGVSRAYAVVPLIDGELYALGTWPVEVFREENLRTAPSVLLPTLMWIASLLVAWLGASSMVTRPIRKLRGAITAFAAGDHRMERRDIGRAPLEIRQLWHAFEQMTQTIIYDKAELENAIHQKEVLLREVHHRVKNNLQLIASIMNMQMRQTRSEEAKWLMHGLRDRVMSLATIHRGLYQTTGLTDIRADELLADILQQVVKMGTGPGRRFAVKSSFAPLRLTPDQAVPLALLLTEALTNALKYASSTDGRPADLSVTFEEVDAARARLLILNSVGSPVSFPDEQSSTGLGSQLLEAFAQQIGGVIETENRDGEFCLSVTFDLRPLDEAEARNIPAATDVDIDEDDDI